MTLESVLRTAIVIAFSRSVRFYHEDKQKNMRFFSYAMLAVSIHIVGYIHGNIETKANAEAKLKDQLLLFVEVGFIVWPLYVWN